MRTLLISLLILSACGRSRDNVDDDPAGAPPVRPGGGGGGGGGANPDQAQACAKMDIVFVVDNSGSMAEEQQNLAANFPRFISLLEAFRNGDGKPLDYRVAITTTGRDLNYKIVVPPPFSIELPFNEKGENGVFLEKQDCGMTRRWLQRGDAGDVGKTFACAAKVGTGGPSLEMPLYSLSLAFNERMADKTNVGFLREDALLATVILTDEDDCSREDNNFSISSDSCDGNKDYQPVARYIDMLDKVKNGRGRWASAVIAGETACKSQFGDAIEAKRLKEFVTKTGNTAVFSSICAGDLTTALQDALKTFSAACESFPPLG